MDFFKDCPWLKIPSHRRGEILVEPLYPPGGLAGGSPSAEGRGKVSKLAALSAARKKKEEKRRDDNNDLGEAAERISNGAVGLLDRLSYQRNSRSSKDEGTSGYASNELNTSVLHRESRTHGYLSRKEQAQAVRLEREPIEALESSVNEAKLSAEVDLKASPSAFATIITGETSYHAPFRLGSRLGEPFNISYLTQWIKTECAAFIGPSPDDIVTSAQRSKGESAISKMTWRLD